MNKETSIDQLKPFLKEMFQFNANDLEAAICVFIPCSGRNRIVQRN